MSDTTGLEEVGPVAGALALKSPRETRDWLILKEGYLVKTKLAKKVMKSKKLRWFVLKQNPVSYEARLEYYEGMLLKGSITLKDVRVVPAKKPGTILLETNRAVGVTAKSGKGRSMTLMSEKNPVPEATIWILAIRQAAADYADHTKKTATAKQSSTQPQTMSSTGNVQAHVEPAVVPDLPSDGSDVSSRRKQPAEEVDGAQIDAARWNALRKRQQTDEDEEIPEDLEDDEDVQMLRQMEEEEERRQEAERLAFLAERQAKLEAAKAQKQQDQQAATDMFQSDGKASEKPVGADVEEAREVPSGELQLQVEEVDGGEVSEDDDWDWEEEERLMRLAEEEEERKQEEERQAWLKEQAAKKAASESS
eukprot:m.32638 g.32638  ORF g.32638 m.32638 type:complete len:365 (-) comp9539_c1_seq1:191-1285(-)